MAKTVNGDPRKRWKVKVMECTGTIQKTSMINGPKKMRGRANPKKMAGARVQGTVKTKLEIVEMAKTSLYPHIVSL